MGYTHPEMSFCRWCLTQGLAELGMNQLLRLNTYSLALFLLFHLLMSQVQYLLLFQRMQGMQIKQGST